MAGVRARAATAARATRVFLATTARARAAAIARASRDFLSAAARARIAAAVAVKDARGYAMVL